MADSSSGQATLSATLLPEWKCNLYSFQMALNWQSPSLFQEIHTKELISSNSSVCTNSLLTSKISSLHLSAWDQGNAPFILSHSFPDAFSPPFHAPHHSIGSLKINIPVQQGSSRLLKVFWQAQHQDVHLQADLT